jgi:hypothetical protein
MPGRNLKENADQAKFPPQPADNKSAMRFRITETFSSPVRVIIARRRSINPDAGRIRLGDNRANTAEILALRRPASQPTLAVPKMIDPPNLPFKIMADQFRTGLFLEYMRGIRFGGRSSIYLQSQLDDPERADKILVCVNLYDGIALAEKMNEHHPDRLFRLPTEAEWDSVLAEPLVADSLRGGFYNWTSTPLEPGRNEYILRTLANGNRNYSHPEDRFSNFALRLVEDKIK